MGRPFPKITGNILLASGLKQARLTCPCDGDLHLVARTRNQKRSVNALRSARDEIQFISLRWLDGQPGSDRVRLTEKPSQTLRKIWGTVRLNAIARISIDRRQGSFLPRSRSEMKTRPNPV